MAISNYSELKTAVANWLNRDDLTSYIPDFIEAAEERVSRDLRIRAMETALNDTIASGVLSVPSDYRELKLAYIDTTPTQVLTRVNLDFIYFNYATRSGGDKPIYIAREGDNFIFGPYPDSGYTVKGIYYAKLPALSDSNTTNWFTANAVYVLLWGALAEAEPFLANDSRTITWETKYQEELGRLQKEERRESRSGSPGRMQVR